jgi:hypothetical protein
VDGDQPQRGRIGGIVVVVLGAAVLLAVIVVALVVGGFFAQPSSPTTTGDPAELVRMAPAALAEAPGLAYQLSVESNEGGGLMGLKSSGQIDLHSQRFVGSADPGRAASMLLFGGPNRGSVVLADGLFVQADGGPWEAMPAENAGPLRHFVDPTALANAVGVAIEGAQIDPTVETRPCEDSTCQVVKVLFAPQVASNLVARLSDQPAEPPPPDLLPMAGELWLDPESGFPSHLVIDATAGGTATKVVLDLERLDPPPAIVPPAP